MQRPALPTEGERAAAKTRPGWRGWLLRPRQLILMPVLLILLILAALVIGLAFHEPQITVSRETTYFVEPLDNKGHVDYLAALNRKGSVGVTPGNNAAVLLARTVDPTLIAGDTRDKFHEFGIEPLRPGEAFFKDFAGKDARNEVERTEPWTADQNPALAAWIESHASQFNLVVEASKRPRFFEPVVDATLDCPEFLLTPTFNSCRGLACRAALRLGQGDLAAAWADLLAVHRLSRLISARQSTLSVVFASAIHTRAVVGTLVLVRSLPVNEPLLQQMREDLQELSDLPRFIDTHEYERCRYLKSVQMAFRNPQALSDLSQIDPIAAQMPHWIKRRAVNWDVVLKRANEWADRWEAIAALPLRPSRRTALQHFEKDLAAAPSGAWAEVGLQGSRAMADSVIQSYGGTGFYKSDDRSSAGWIVLQTQLAVKLWQLQHGTDPAKLVDLYPDFMSEPPIDPFTELPLKYRHVGDELRIYSVWSNDVDDGGLRVEESGGKDDFSATVPEMPRSTLNQK